MSNSKSSKHLEKDGSDDASSFESSSTSPEPKRKKKCENLSSSPDSLRSEDQTESSVKDKNSNILMDKYFFQTILREFSDDEITVDECIKECRTTFQRIWQIEQYWLVLTRKTENHWLENIIDVIVKKRLKSKESEELSANNFSTRNDHIAYKISSILNICTYGKFPTPFCYFANEEMIIVSNLFEEGYTEYGNNEDCITLKQCEQILKACARFHSATIVLKYQEPQRFKETKDFCKHNFFYPTNSTVLVQQQAILQTFKSAFMEREPTEENEIKIEALEYLIQYTQTGIEGLLDNPEDTHVFCHGNLLPKNCLFKQEGNKVVVKFINFQEFCFFSLASDLVHLFFVNLHPDEYIDNETNLLTYYHHYLTKYIQERDIPLDTKLTIEWLENEVFRFTEYGIIYALWRLSVIYCSDKNQRKEEMKESMNERLEKWIDYYYKIYCRKHYFQKLL